MANLGRQGGGNRKTVANTSEPPWASWKGYSRPAHAIKFMETYCRTPVGYRPGQPIILSNAQKDFFEEILSGEYKQAVKSCPRGEGKSTEMAALALWATFAENESGPPQVPIISTTVGQAKFAIYDVALAMLELEPELADRAYTFTGMGTTRIESYWGNGKCWPMANKVSGLQGLNPTVAIMDEIGFQSELAWNSLVLALGKRPWSLVVGTGTPGTDYENALWAIRSGYLKREAEREEARRKGEEESKERLSYTEIAADPECDLKDPVSRAIQIRKANPSIDAGYKNADDIEDKYQTMPESAFRIFHLGQWVEGVESWLGDTGLATWRGLVDPYELALHEPTWVGIDVGLKSDSTAVVWGQRRPDGRLHVKCKIWYPEPGRIVDLPEVLDFLRDLHRRFKVQSFAYDPMLFQLPALGLFNEGLPMVEMKQSPERMAPAFTNLLRAVKTGGISHDDDSLFEKQILAGRPKNSERGFTLYKMKYTMKIDACYALAMMFDRAQHVKPEQPALVVL